MTLQSLSRLGIVRLFQELIDEEIAAGGNLKSLKKKIDGVEKKWSEEDETLSELIGRFSSRGATLERIEETIEQNGGILPEEEKKILASILKKALSRGSALEIDI